MPDDPRQPDAIDAAIQRAFEPRRRLSRRAFITQAGRGGIILGGALSLPAILAACGIAPAASRTPSGSTGGSPRPLPSKAGIVNFANWPAYIDIDSKTKTYPTLEKFKKETGIQVNYVEAVNDNEEFFGTIQPDLAAGNQTVWDLMVLTDWMIERMVRLGYLAPLDHAALPNFTANADTLYVNPWYDKGNTFSAAWQSGITGIGYNPKLTKRPITTFDDLLDPAFRGRVGMFSEMRDTMCMALLSLGVKPENATVDDVKKAADKLKKARQAKQFRNFYGNDYYNELANGNLALTIAWSGDVSQMRLADNPDVQFVVPQSGGMRWVDNMCIPKAPKHPTDAHAMINFWYDPVNAKTLSEYIGYFSPVKSVPDLIKKDAQAAAAKGDKATASELTIKAAAVTPSPEALKNVYTYKILSESEERQWNNLFQAVVTG